MIIVPTTIANPASITVVFYTPTFGVDLTTVTAIVANVSRRDGTATTFPFSIVSATSRELTARYVFSGSGEITTSGVYYLNFQLSVPGGTIPATAVAMLVSDASPPKLEDTSWVSATSNVDGLGIKNTWTMVSAATYQASPYAPYVAANLSSNAIALTLWQGSDGDVFMVNDYLAAAGTHNLTLNAYAGQKVPTGSGTYGASAVFSTNGFTARLKYSAALGQWMVW